MESQEKQVALKLDNIVKIYGDNDNKVTALKGVSLCFRKNEFVSILGPSGCGKTTLLNIIGGLDRYTSGDLVIDGKSTKEYKDGDWDTYRNNSIGFVFQSYNLIPHQTVLSNVELALTLSGVTNAERKKRAKEVLAKVGLKGLENKLPNQMSGGQMQRVAIARALVNDPEIILADEPTGALDTETSIQVMELLKEVAKDRLVIMVTHNPELAKTYSTRIINLLDGEKTGDTNPLELTETVDEVKPQVEGVKVKRSAMKVFTAFALSLSNLKTKRGRTILTAIAGSIGIIGIALVLAVSTGFSTYINKLQAQTLSVYPLTVSEATVDLSDFQKLTNKVITDKEKAQRLTQKVYTKAMFGDLTSMLKSNDISKEWLAYVNEYVDNANKNPKSGNAWEYCVKKGYGFDVNNYIFANIGLLGNTSVIAIDSLVRNLEGMFNAGLKNSNMSISAELIRQYIPTVSEIPENQTLIESQYEKLYGEWAKKEDELLLVVDKYNRVSDITLALLGYRTIKSIDKTTYKVEFGGDETFTFESALKQKFYYIDNDTRYYSYTDGSTTKYIEYGYNESSIQDDSRIMKLKITGIVRLKEDVTEGVLDTGIAYTSKFVDKVLSSNLNSKIVNDTKYTEGEETKYKQLDVYSSMFTKDLAFNYARIKLKKLDVNHADVIKAFENTDFQIMSVSNNIRALAGNEKASKISIYSVDYAAKESLKKYLDSWNDKYSKEEDKTKQVHYSDSTALLFSALNTTVDSVKIVLICFTAISLVVSSIMIGIITYVSVVERTKEIGVLRSIGARKKDISRIFNAETFLIGLFAGLLGVAVTYLLSIPINLIVGSLIANAGRIASLPVLDALILVVVSFVLTLIAGIIPAKIAARKDPVVALRSE